MNSFPQRRGDVSLSLLILVIGARFLWQAINGDFAGHQWQLALFAVLGTLLSLIALFGLVRRRTVRLDPVGGEVKLEDRLPFSIRLLRQLHVRNVRTASGGAIVFEDVRPGRALVLESAQFSPQTWSALGAAAAAFGEPGTGHLAVSCPARRRPACYPRVTALALLAGGIGMTWLTRGLIPVALLIPVFALWAARAVSPRWRYWREMWLVSAALHALPLFLLLPPIMAALYGRGPFSFAAILAGASAWLLAATAASVYASENDRPGESEPR